MSEKGQIDVLIANGGIVKSASLGSISESHLIKYSALTSKGFHRCFKDLSTLPLFQEGGSIILTASVGRSRVECVYNATKAAIQSFARFWIVNLKHREICVNAISTRSIDSPGISQLFENGQQVQEIKKTLLNTIPMGRDGNPNASDDSSFTTGIELFVDGARG